MLMPAQKGAPPECHRAYDIAKSPKRYNEILTAINQICTSKGGSYVSRKLFTLSGSSSKIPDNYTSELGNEFSAILFTCVGQMPTDRLFSCQFSTSFEDI